MLLDTNKIIKSQDVTLIENKNGISNILEICPSGSNEGPMHKVDKSPTMQILPKDDKDQFET